MKDRNRDDWLSRTVRMVEMVMVENGFYEDGPEKQLPRLPINSGNRRNWIAALASALRMQKFIPQ